MAGVGAEMKIFHGNTIPTAKPITLKTDNGTAAIASIECLEHSLGVQVVYLKTVAFYLSKVRDRLVIPG